MQTTPPYKMLRINVEMYENTTDPAIYHVVTYEIEQKDGWRILEELERAQNCLAIRQDARQLNYGLQAGSITGLASAKNPSCR